MRPSIPAPRRALILKFIFFVQKEKKNSFVAQIVLFFLQFFVGNKSKNLYKMNRIRRIQMYISSCYMHLQENTV